MRSLLRFTLPALLVTASALDPLPTDTLGGPCSLPSSSSACPHACPLIDGVAMCLPVLQECDECNPLRVGGDGVCDPSLVCDEEFRQCRGVGFGQLCGSNGKKCDEDLVCVTPFRPFLGGYDPAACFEAGGVGERCNVAAATRGFVPGDGRELKACAEGLSCLPSIGGPNTLKESFCTERTGEGEPCVEGYCSEGLECKRENGIGNECVRLRTLGEACDDWFSCARETQDGEELACSSAGTCAEAIPLGGACDPTIGACQGRYDGKKASCADVGKGDFKCALALPAGGVCNTNNSTCWREGLIFNELFFWQSPGERLRCDAGICANDEDAGGLYQICFEDSDCTPSGRSCGDAQDGVRRCLDLGTLGSECSNPRANWDRVGISGMLCPKGSTCSAKGEDFTGTCVADGKTFVGFGEECGNDGGSTQCIEKDESGNRLVCASSLQEDEDGKKRCVRRALEGESCTTENTVCDVEDYLRNAFCDEENICRVLPIRDYRCNDDNDCDSTGGESCICAPEIRISEGSPVQFACLKYNQKLGEVCETTTPFYTIWSMKCADGQNLTCRRTGTGRSVQGICSIFVGEAQRCDEGENLFCKAGLACLNGSCQYV